MLAQRNAKPIVNSYQRISCDAVQSLTVPAGTAYVKASAEAQAIRWRDDGTDPSAVSGYPQAIGQEFFIDSPANFRVIAQVAGGFLNVCYYGDTYG